MVKIDHVIWVYFSLTGTTVRLWTTLTFVFHWTMAESSINSNHWIYESKWFLLSLYSSESYHLLEYTLKLFNLACFLAHVQQFSSFLDKLEVWVSSEAVRDTFYQFFCLIIYNGIQPFATFTEYRIYNYWNWFVLWWRKLGSENMQIPDFFEQHSHVFPSRRRVKTLQILVELF